VETLRPNVVVIGFFLGNDVANHLPNYSTGGMNCPKFDIVRGKLNPLPFRMGFTAGTQQHLDRSWFYRTFLAPSLLYQQYKLYERDLRTKLGIKKSQKTNLEQDRPFWERSYAPTDWQTYLPKPPLEFERAWQITEQLLLKLNQEIQASGAKCSVVLIPGLESIDPASFQASLHRYPGIEDFKFDLEWPSQRLLKFLGKNHISVIDLTPALAAAAKTQSPDQLYFKYDRHFSIEGHQVAGKTIAEHLTPN
jgi:hypothetical protein